MAIVAEIVVFSMLVSIVVVSVVDPFSAVFIAVTSMLTPSYANFLLDIFLCQKVIDYNC